MARATKAALAAPNVVMLPHAAPRQVRQRWNKETRAERQRLRRECPWPGVYQQPHARDADKLAATMREAERTPALMIASAILGGMNEADRQRVMIVLAANAQGGTAVDNQALVLASLSRMTFGEANDLRRGLDRADGVTL